MLVSCSSPKRINLRHPKSFSGVQEWRFAMWMGMPINEFMMRGKWGWMSSKKCFMKKFFICRDSIDDAVKPLSFVSHPLTKWHEKRNFCANWGQLVLRCHESFLGQMVNWRGNNKLWFWNYFSAVKLAQWNVLSKVDCLPGNNLFNEMCKLCQMPTVVQPVKYLWTRRKLRQRLGTHCGAAENSFFVCKLGLGMLINYVDSRGLLTL